MLVLIQPFNFKYDIGSYGHYILPLNVYMRMIVMEDQMLEGVAADTLSTAVHAVSVVSAVVISVAASYHAAA